MECKKNWFYNIWIVLSLVFFLFLFSMLLGKMVQETSFPYLLLGKYFFGLFSLLILIRAISWLVALIRIDSKLHRHTTLIRVARAIVVVVFLVIALLQRIDWVNGAYECSAEDNIYYQIAQHLVNGTLLADGQQYCDMIAAHPYLLGYAIFLKTAFLIGGTNILSGFYLNILFSILVIIFLYRIGCKLSGELGGLFALCVSVFWHWDKSQILVLSPEMLVRCLACSCVLVLLHLMMDYNKDRGNGAMCFVWCIVLGFMFAIAVAVQVEFLIMMLAMVVCLLPLKLEMPNKPLNDIPLMLRAVQHGWKRCLIALLPFLLLSWIFTTNMKMVSDRDITFVNRYLGEAQENGLVIGQMLEWNQAQWNLLAKKANDFVVDYANPMVLVMSAFSLIGLLALYRRKGNYLYVLLLWFYGNFVYYLLVNGSRKYILDMVSLLILLAGHGVNDLFETAKEERRAVLEKMDWEKEKEQLREKELQAYKEVEAEVARIREEALSNVFDMNYALQNGHVIMTVSEAVSETSPVENK